MMGLFLQALSVARSSGADVSGIGFLAPILVFVIVVIVLAALLMKIKILGDNNWVAIFLALAIGVIFVATESMRELLLNVIPWFAVLLIALFFILTLTMFISKDGTPTKFLSWGFLVLIAGVFVIAAIKIFTGSLFSYIPGPFYGVNADPELIFFFDWFYSPRIIGGFWLVVAAVITSTVLIKTGVKKD